MTHSNDCVVLDDRELEIIAAGAAMSVRRQDGHRSAPDLLPSVGLPRPELEESLGSASGANHSLGLA